MATSTTTLGTKPGVAAFDIKEFFHAHIGAKTRFGDHIIRQFEADLVGQDRAVAVGDIGKRTGMHEHRRAFQGLHQVGLNGIFHQHGHRAGHAQVFGGDGFAALADADHHPAQALRAYPPGSVVSARMAMISLATVISNPVSRSKPFSSGALADGDPAQEAVVGIHHAPPGDGLRVNIQPAEAPAFFRGQLVRDRRW